MNWDAIGAVGEIIGALAVVASLVYQAIQICSQNRETRMLAVHALRASASSEAAAVASTSPYPAVLCEAPHTRRLRESRFQLTLVSRLQKGACVQIL